jgi:protein SCO1
MRIFLFALAALAAGCSPSERTAKADPACFNRSSPKIGGPFRLTSHTGAPVTEDNYKGHKTLIFFGYTHCPDVCPATLFQLGTAMRMLPKNVKAPKTVLISVDPARDTPEALAQYIASNGFPSDIEGLTGTLDEIQQVADEFAAPFNRDEDADSASGYILNHSAILYLMDENWKLKTFFLPEERAESIARCIAAMN